MKRYGMLTIIIVAVAALGVAHCTFSEEDESMGAALAVGAAAPAFSLPGSDGKTYRLEDYAGKQAVVIAWFPKAFTGG
jgi:peroxiredoxin